MTELPDVRPGQVWADNDPRSAGRHVKVMAVTGRDHARPHSARVQPCNPYGHIIGTRVTWIALARMRPTSNGYRLIKDAEVAP